MGRIGTRFACVVKKMGISFAIRQFSSNWLWPLNWRKTGAAEEPIEAISKGHLILLPKGWVRQMRSLRSLTLGEHSAFFKIGSRDPRAANNPKSLESSLRISSVKQTKCMINSSTIINRTCEVGADWNAGVCSDGCYLIILPRREIAFLLKMINLAYGVEFCRRKRGIYYICE